MAQVKISELTAKGSALQGTDLLEISQLVGSAYVSKSVNGGDIIDAAQTGMQTELISGTNIKTINSSSILGSGDLSVGTVTSVGLTTDALGTDVSVSGSPITGSGSITLSIPTASALNTGKLSKTDWTTFNNKQDALVSGTNIKTINGNSLLGSGDLVVGGGGLTIGTTAITSGTIGRILFEGTGNVVQESANLFWDNTNGRLGIGTASPSSYLNVVSSSATIPSLLISGTNPYSGSPVRDYLTINGTGNVGISMITNTGGYVAQRFYSGTTELGVFYCQESTKDFVFKNSGSGFIDFQTGGGNSSRLRIFNNGNVAIGTTTDAGYKLDVNGTARVQSGLTISGQTANNYLTIGTGTGNAFFTWSAYFLGVNGVKFRSENLIGDPSGSATTVRASAAIDSRGYLVTDSIGIGTTTNTINASAIAQIDSTTKGFLPPRMTTTQRNAIATPAAGLIVYDTTDNKHYGYNGTAWTAFY